MFVCPSVQVTLVATKLLVRLFILTFNQYTYIIIRFCCITTICSDGSTVTLRRFPIWIITWPRLTEYWYFSPQKRPLFIKFHAESLWAHWKCHRYSTTDSFFSFLYPRSLKGEGGILLTLSVQDIFRRIFLSNCWWQKSDIWSQASNRYPISWEAFFDPSDSYFLFAEERGYHKWALAHSSSGRLLVGFVCLNL